ncbi:MAG: GNAT family N-acetyltransferase [Thermosynechococcaceae cyanobacterium]
MALLPTGCVIRAAKPGDAADIFGLIQELAHFEKLEQSVTGSPEQLAEHLFREPTYAEAVVATLENEMVGFALFFTNYSTFLTRPGLYLEDLFVRSAHRRQGIGTALLQQVAKIALERHCGRMEWSVLDWNEGAIATYETLGATVLPDWRICRITGDNLNVLAHRSS